ncbi:MAG: hypothetical protein MI674_01815 [Cytophagales bacterium]|nr:hypothetical protein [Cytophagales bacterium]
MLTILLSIVLVAIFFILMTLRIIFLKKGEFKGTCASQSPFLHQAGSKCSYCGKKTREKCGNDYLEIKKEKIVLNEN